MARKHLRIVLVLVIAAASGCNNDGNREDSSVSGDTVIPGDGKPDAPVSPQGDASSTRDQGPLQSDTGTAPCPQTPCEYGLECCSGICKNLNNDPTNCGECGYACPPETPFCSGTCQVPPCSRPQDCTGGQICCGASCCAVGKICCVVNHGPSVMECHDGPACPPGCPGCVCAAPDTLIATPSGERAIAELRPGDLVISWHRGALRAVPINRVRRVSVVDHQVVRVRFESGRVLNISAAHSTADGRTFGQLHVGDWLAGTRVSSISIVPYPFRFTHDILPMSDTGSYIAGGVLIGTTLVH